MLVAVMVTETFMGRSFFCTCGRIAFWTGSVHGPENSQQLSDWYSLTHVVHGLILFGVLTMAFRRVPVMWRLVLAMLVEALWEIAENSPSVIARYRAATAAFGYIGDSILNSLGDIGFMMIGFAIARYASWRVSLGVALALEAITLIAIRDDLTLNVLMLVHPIAAVKIWQAG